MELPNDFKFGRFKLESYFVNCNNVPYIININDIIMIIEEGKCDIDEKLSKGEIVKVRLCYESSFYLIKIEDKEWVYIEKI